MSQRWYANSAVFRSTLSFTESAVFDEKTLEKVRLLKIIDYLPVLVVFEKALLILDYCQLFAILWVMAQPWPWPYLWTSYTSFIVYTNIDIFSTTTNGALNGRSTSLYSKWGMMDNYCEYALIYACIQGGIFALALSLLSKWDVYGQVPKETRHRYLSILLVISYILYLPCSLATFRLYYCDAENNLSADPAVQCFGTKHSIYFAVCSALTLPVFVGLPCMVYKYVADTIVYTYDTDHEKRLQIWEILQMLSLDDHWLRKQLWLTSSFNKFGAFFRLHMILLKAWMLVLFVFFRFSLRLQSVLCTLTALFFCGYYSIGALIDHRKYLPYRNTTSNMMLLCTFALMIINSIFGMFNQFGVQNAITVGSTQSYFMWACSFVATVTVGLLAVYQVYHFIVRKIYDWPSVHTLNRIWHNEELVSKASLWVQSIRESFIVKADFLLAPAEVADIEALEECIRTLRACWMSARSIGSLFEVPLSESLEELLYIHSTRYPVSLRRHPYWNNTYTQPAVRQALHKRYYDHSLMTPKKRRVLFKLLAIRFMKGDRGEFSMDVALKQARQDEVERTERTKREAELLALIHRRKQEIAVAHQNMKVNHFSNFAANAQFLLFGGTLGLMGSSMSVLDPAAVAAAGGAGADGAPKEGDLEQGAAAGEDGRSPLHLHFDALGQLEEEDAPRFPAEDVEEARKMIERLITRTELALNKHHNAKKNMIAQENKALAQAIAQSSSSVALTGGLAKISTMELIKETVDIEEQNDLEELYFLWDEAIQLYELEEFPGDYEVLNRAAENWYTYRSLVTQRLEVVAQTLHERNYDALIDNHEVIEEGEESDEEEDEKLLPSAGAGASASAGGSAHRGTLGPGHISPRLQQLQQLSSRATLPRRPTNMSATTDVDDFVGFEKD